MPSPLWGDEGSRALEFHRAREHGPRALAVRHHEHLPLSVRAGDDRLGGPDRVASNRVAPLGQPRATAAGPILRRAAADQRRGRRSDRTGSGVRVRHELVGLLTVRRRRVRCTAGDGGARRVLPRVDVPGAVDVRLGPPAQADPPGLHLAGGDRVDAVGRIHPGGQLVDAASGRLLDQLEHPPATAQQRAGAVHQPDVPVGLRARDPGVRGHRMHGHARRVGVVSAQGDRGVRVQALGDAVTGRRDPDARTGAVRGQRAGGGRSQVPTGQDRRGRGGVDDLPAVLVLGVPGRRRQAGRDADKGDRDPLPAVVPGYELVQRQGHRPQRATAAVHQAVREGQLHPERVHPVLVDAGDGLPGGRAVRVRGLGRVAAAP